MKLRLCTLWVAFFCLVGPSQAEVKLHNLFTDHMVLQRGIDLPVWGWADDNEEITVEFRGRKAKTRARDGKWMVRLGKFQPGGPDELKVTGKNSITVQDVLVGEVWIASGQSNMEWPLRASFEPTIDIQSAANPQLRLFTVPKLKADMATNNVNSAWVETAPATVSNFSAVAYYFGVHLQKELGVPVGLIHTSWGGSPAEVWMSEKVLSSNPRYLKEILASYPAQRKKFDEDLAGFEEEQAAAKRDGKPFTRMRPWDPWKPCELYNGMIAPLIPYAIRGAIWYQGESNAGRAYQYRSLFVDLIRNWRTDWDQGDFPFLHVQLAPFMAITNQPGESAWAELREAQSLACEVLPKVGMAVITDWGDENDIHPKWKKPVGTRLALAALGIAYKQKLVYSGPVFHSAKVKGDKVILTFEQIGGGLFGRALPRRVGEQSSDAPGLNFRLENTALHEPLVGFAIAGADHKFVWGQATIDGDKVIVSSPDVPKPVAVRYGWANYPVVNLFCSTGPGQPPLPASPFRTDDWPLTTEPKQEKK